MALLPSPPSIEGPPPSMEASPPLLLSLHPSWPPVGQLGPTRGRPLLDAPSATVQSLQVAVAL
jgi:hypothetical protein